MERQQPGKERQGERRRDQQERRFAFPQPEVGQVAPNDLCECRQYEQQGGPKHSRRTVMGRWSHLTPPQDTTPAESPAEPPTESTAWSGARPAGQTLVDGAGQQGEAVPADLVAEVLAGDADRPHAGGLEDIPLQVIPLFWVG